MCIRDRAPPFPSLMICGATWLFPARQIGVFDAGSELHCACATMNGARERIVAMRHIFGEIMTAPGLLYQGRYSTRDGHGTCAAGPILNIGRNRRSAERNERRHAGWRKLVCSIMNVRIPPARIKQRALTHKYCSRKSGTGEHKPETPCRSPYRTTAILPSARLPSSASSTEKYVPLGTIRPRPSRPSHVAVYIDPAACGCDGTTSAISCCSVL